MSKKAFTLIEIFAVVIVVGILAVLALPYFQNVLERSKDEVCVTNIEALKRAVDIQVIEQEVVPASLAAVPQKYIDAAYAQVWQKKSWKLKLARFILNREWQSLAYASNRFPHLRCPKNPVPESISYGLNRDVATISAAEYKALPEGTIIVGDAENYVADFCKVTTIIIKRNKRVFDILTEVVCPNLSDLIKSRGHVKHGLLGKKDKFLIGSTRDDVLVRLVK